MEEFVVSILEDENDGDLSAGDLSLREAIATAESGDTITFDESLSGGTIALVDGELAIDKSLTINGLGAENIIIDANGINRVFNIDDGNEDTQIDVALNGLAITGSSRGEFDFDGTSTLLNSGGGILNSENLEVNNTDIYNNEVFYSGAGISSSGTLTVNNSAIYSNVVRNDANSISAAGGGISSSGTLTVNNSAIYSNSVSVGDAGATGGGIANAGTATINQSTINDNGVGGRGNNGGGIENREGDLTITNSTISGNGSNLAGGIFNNAGEVTVTSTIIANVISGDDFTSGGNNFISGEAEVGSRGGPIIIGAEGFINGENGDIVGTLENPIDPLLGELQDNGGSTPTQALLEGSPAIDAGSNPNDLATDQRGVGFDRTVGDGTDIGAFELQTTDLGDGSDNQDNDNTIATANESGISPDGQQNVVLNDAIAFNSDVDLFRLNLEAADVATFNIEAVEFGSSLDSVLRVFDSEGNELAFDDDGNAPFEDASFDSYLEFTPETDGEYYVGVSSFSNFDYDPVNGGNAGGLSSGDYDLAISVFDGIDGTDGADNLSGGDSSDFIRGLGGNDTLSGNGDKDNLLGGSGNDVLTGGDGDDLLQGGDGFDVLRGGNGNDTLGGGTGQNNLYGGQGNDIFAIGEGEDTVFDFQDGSDKLLLTGSLDFVAFEDLSISASDTGTTIGTSDTTFATLTGISPDQITADDLVSPNFLAATFIANDTAAIEAKAV